MTQDTRSHADTSAPGARPIGSRLALYITARTISVLGNSFGWIALIYAVHGLPGASPMTASLVLASQAVPHFALTLFGGVIGDRMSRGRLIVAAETLAALAWGALGILSVGHVGGVAIFCVLAGITGLATALFTPAYAAILPSIVPSSDLRAANSRLRLFQNSALVAGLALAGPVVSVLGPGVALILDAISFVVSALIIGFLRLPGPASTQASSFITQLREGGREFFSRQWAWSFVLCSSLIAAAFNACYGILGPLLAIEHYDGVRSWALLEAAQAIGAVGGAGLARRVRTPRAMLVAAIAALPIGLPMLLLGMHAPLLACALACLLAGVSNDVSTVLWATSLQTLIPDRVLSRVNAYDVLGAAALSPLGLIAAGPAAQMIGLGWASLACGLLVMTAVTLALASPQLRRLRLPSSSL